MGSLNVFGITIDSLLRELQYDPQSPMIFTSGLFLFAFVFFIFIYYLLRNQRLLRILFVTFFSYYFYYKSSGVHFVVLALVSIADWHIAGRIYRLQTCFGLKERGVERWRTQQKCLLILSVVLDLGLLAYFKYTNMLCTWFAALIGREACQFDIILPVGISFFTFQSLSYTIDVYRGTLKPIHSLLQYAFYISFFPQLVAGPIVRASEFIPQIKKKVFVSDDMINKAVLLIASGIFKKSVISDYISINFVDRVFDNPVLYSGFENLLALYGYAIQIYCDFSGYSDIAIGIALLLGFHFPKNFDAPYKSLSIQEFWRRWHMTLSFWLRDYLYIFWLGGNRVGKIRSYINLFLTMLFGGLWHGASLNFILWGGLHGIGLMINKAYREIVGCENKIRSSKVVNVLCFLLTFHFVTAGWLLFRCENFSNAVEMLVQITTKFGWQLIPQVIEGYWQVLSIMTLAFVLHFMPKTASSSTLNVISKMPIVLKAFVISFIAYIVIQVKSSDIQPFIYFQF